MGVWKIVFVSSQFLLADSMSKLRRSLWQPMKEGNAKEFWHEKLARWNEDFTLIILCTQKYIFIKNWEKLE